MAKKKNQNKRHKFKYSEPTGVPSNLSSAAPTSDGFKAPQLRTNAAVAAANSRDFSYVGADIRRILVFTGALVGLELVLWYVLGHTGFGAAVYNLIQV